MVAKYIGKECNGNCLVRQSATEAENMHKLEKAGPSGISELIAFIQSVFLCTCFSYKKHVYKKHEADRQKFRNMGRLSFKCRLEKLFLTREFFSQIRKTMRTTSSTDLTKPEHPFLRHICIIWAVIVIRSL